MTPHGERLLDLIHDEALAIPRPTVDLLDREVKLLDRQAELDHAFATDLGSQLARMRQEYEKLLSKGTGAIA